MDKYILWDHDGVLVDTEYWYFKSTQRALSELEISLDKSIYSEFMFQRVRALRALTHVA